MSERFGGDQTGGTYSDGGGDVGDLDDQRFGTEGGTVGIDWSAEAGGQLGADTEIVMVDIDFANSAQEDVVVALAQEARIVALGRLYIDTDPGSAFDQWAQYTFHSNSAKTGVDAFYRNVVKLAYSELEVATTGSDANITPDEHSVFAEQDLIHFLGSSEFARIETRADTLIAEDTVGAYAIDTGLVRVSEFSGFTLFNDADGTDAYLRIKFGSAQTVSLKMVMVLVK